MKTNLAFWNLLSPLWTSVAVVAVVFGGLAMALAPVLCAPLLLTAALAVTAIMGLVVFSRVRNVRRLLAAVDAYADREIALSRRLPRN